MLHTVELNESGYDAREQGCDIHRRRATTFDFIVYCV